MDKSKFRVDGIALGDPPEAFRIQSEWQTGEDCYYITWEKLEGSLLLGSHAELSENQVVRVYGRRLFYGNKLLFDSGDDWALAFEKLGKSQPTGLIQEGRVSTFRFEDLGLRVEFYGRYISDVELRSENYVTAELGVARRTVD